MYNVKILLGNMNLLKVSIYLIVTLIVTANVNCDENNNKCNISITEKSSDGREFSYNIIECCPGYNEDGNGICIPSCRQTCKRGFCKAPDVCGCRDGYELKNNECFPKCKNKCVDGFCIKPNVCGCPKGFELDANNSTLCVPVCYPKCQKFAKCTKSLPPSPNRCQCIDRFIENKETNICEPICKNKCINGFCSAPDTCTCNEGYEMEASNKTNCIPNCNPKCLEFSTCVAPNKCECNDNYKKNVDTNKCDPVCKHQVENSECVKPDTWECKAGYKHDLKIDKCILKSCICQKYGYCLKDKNKCECYNGITKNSTTGQCEPNCEPKCQNSLCVADNDCKCFDGYHQTHIDHICEPNHLCNGKICENGNCLITGECKCKIGFIKSISYDGHIQCDKESTFFSKIMTTILGVPLLLATCILLVVCVMAKKKSYNVEEQEMVLINRR
ncbi:uncharacterized protein ACRADG_005697 [Cochliomyia hominivorax]